MRPVKVKQDATKQHVNIQQNCFAQSTEQMNKNYLKKKK